MSINKYNNFSIIFTVKIFLVIQHKIYTSIKILNEKKKKSKIDLCTLYVGFMWRCNLSTLFIIIVIAPTLLTNIATLWNNIDGASNAIRIPTYQRRSMKLYKNYSLLK